MFLSLSILIVSTAYSDSERQGGKLVLNNATSSSVSMLDVLSMGLSKLEGMGLSIPDQFRIEYFDSQWKIKFCSNDCESTVGDEFLLDEAKGELSLNGEVNLLHRGIYDRKKYDALIKIFTNTHKDAVSAYGENLESAYYARINLKDGFLYVDYELKNPKARGGGPHYKIDFVSFEVLEKRYDQ